MKQNSNFNKYHSKTMRLRGWNYSSESIYFITIRTNSKGNILGEIIDGDMQANKIGQIAEKFIKEISKYFNNTTTHASVIMPDHAHILLEINKQSNNKPHHGVVLQCLSLSDASRHGVMRLKQGVQIAPRYIVAKII